QEGQAEEQDQYRACEPKPGLCFVRHLRWSQCFAGKDSLARKLSTTAAIPASAILHPVIPSPCRLITALPLPRLRFGLELACSSGSIGLPRQSYTAAQTFFAAS